ncbi:hypothetical protein FLONG3_9971 [Fusarium longipes]|uniref:Apple domain-containing protein n=1 Tax=Fusarium longipes TaxID=694270 RepID=A0A395RSU0_9HYPO|nr:hypothetical protein FLONG3_9971 [Fusarium longipes]
MITSKSLFVALAAISTVIASPCKAVTGSVTSGTTTTVSEEATGSFTTETVSTQVEDATTTEMSTTYETGTTIVDETTIIVASTTTDVATTTTTTIETTSAVAVPDNICGVTGFFVDGHAMNFIRYAGNSATLEDCLQGCAAWEGCDLIAYYGDGLRCEYFSGELITDGQETIYKWYDVGCLSNE